MTDRPILFSAPMVRGLLAGAKTQTRRLLKAPRWAMAGYDIELEDDGPYIIAANTGCMAKVPVRFAVGDRLWVKETWSHSGDGVFEIFQARMALNGRVIYRAADADPEFPHVKYWPSLLMPREFSRLTLLVNDVRVQRLQDISAADARAEGVALDDASAEVGDVYYLPGSHLIAGINATPPNKKRIGMYEEPRSVYRDLINALHGDGLWESNPWVVAVSFTVERANIALARPT